MSRSDISVSTVCIGSDSDIELMKSIAAWGEGRNYYTDDPNNIPKIFAGETKIVAKKIISERTLRPQKAMPNEIMQGIDDVDLPVIHGQVITYPKPGASVVIKTLEGPLLAAWRYGLGRSVAFASDLSGRWGKDWARWVHYGRFTAQMVKWAQRKETRKKYSTWIERQGETGTFTVDATTPQRRFLNNLNLQAKIRFPSERSRVIPLDQISPGRYRCTFPAEEIGNYYISLYGETHEDPGGPQVFGFGIPYTGEFNRFEVNHSLLDRLASITNGKVLELTNPPADLFTAPHDAKGYGMPLWPYFAAAFLLLLLADVAARKFLNLTDI
jgi:hypothetical protein